MLMYCQETTQPTSILYVLFLLLLLQQSFNEVDYGSDVVDDTTSNGSILSNKCKFYVAIFSFVHYLRYAAADLSNVVTCIFLLFD